MRTAADTVAAWIDALPAECADRPELQLIAGELAHGQGRFDGRDRRCAAPPSHGFDAAGAPAAQRFAARFALADVLMAAGDLDGVVSLADALEEPDATGNLLARAVGVVAAAGLARQGRFEEGRALFDRALDDPAARRLPDWRPPSPATTSSCRPASLDDALAHAREAVDDARAHRPDGATRIRAHLPDGNPRGARGGRRGTRRRAVGRGRGRSVSVYPGGSASRWRSAARVSASGATTSRAPRPTWRKRRRCGRRGARGSSMRREPRSPRRAATATAR